MRIPGLIFNALGNPLVTDPYRLCLYDESSPSPVLRFEATAPAGGLCGGNPCWSAVAQKGFNYKSADGTPDGLRAILLRAGTAGKAKVTVKGKGAHLANRPNGLALPLALPV